MAKAVVLFSGGLDSSTTLAGAIEQGFTAYALSVDYGQRHKVELTFAAKFAKSHAVAEHRTVSLDLRAIGGVGCAMTRMSSARFCSGVRPVVVSATSALA